MIEDLLLKGGTTGPAKGSLYIWGSQLGPATGGFAGDDGDKIPFSYLTALYSWKAFTKGSYSHAAAIRSDGALFTWGLNASGQLGNNTLTYASAPIQIGTSSWIAVSTGASHTCAIRADGGLFTWGANGIGQLGDGTVTSRSSPVQVGTSSWTAIASAPYGATNGGHNLAIRADGTLWAWGTGVRGQLGDSSFAPRSSPVQVSAAFVTPIVKIAAGYFNSLCIDSAGQLWSWGTFSFGMVGNNTSTGDLGNPLHLGTSSWTAISISAGGTHCAAIRSDGGLFTWGFNASGQLGDGTVVAKSSPVQIGTSSWIAVGCSGANTHAVKLGGTLWGWGIGTLGRIGNNTGLGYSSPVQIGTDTDYSDIQGGLLRTWASKTSNMFQCWGDNTGNMLGLNTNATKILTMPVVVTFANYNLSTPVPISFTGSPSWKLVSMSGGNGGAGHVLAIRSDNLLFAWGSNSYGEIGDGTIIRKNSPVQIGTSSWTVVSASQNTSHAIRSDGALFAWGRNTLNALGDNTSSNRSSPVAILAGSSFVAVKSSYLNTYAISSVGNMYGWGQGTNGAIGDNTAVTKSAPVQIGTGFTWLDISTGQYSAYALRSDFKMFAWGLGTSGQLGDGTIVSKSSPVQIGTSSWTSVGGGGNIAGAKTDGGSWLGTFGSAIRSDGGLFTWGLNTSGQLGNNSVTATSSPVQIGTSSWTAVRRGGSFVMALRTDNTLWAWGGNQYGQLGDGTIVNKSTPVQIGTLKYSNITVAGDATLGITA